MFVPALPLGVTRILRFNFLLNCPRQSPNALHRFSRFLTLNLHNRSRDVDTIFCCHGIFSFCYLLAPSRNSLDRNFVVRIYRLAQFKKKGGSVDLILCNVCARLFPPTFFFLLIVLVCLCFVRALRAQTFLAF